MLGAGVYEEFIFRLVIVSLVMLIGVDLIELPKEPVAVAGVIVAAVVFSLYHLSGPEIYGLFHRSFPGMSAPVAFPWKEFVFRTLAGLYLGGLFVFRGIGIAVDAHAFYNIYVAVALG